MPWSMFALCTFDDIQTHTHTHQHYQTLHHNWHTSPQPTIFCLCIISPDSILRSACWVDGGHDFTYIDHIQSVHVSNWNLLQYLLFRTLNLLRHTHTHAVLFHFCNLVVFRLFSSRSYAFFTALAHVIVVLDLYSYIIVCLAHESIKNKPTTIRECKRNSATIKQIRSSAFNTNIHTHTHTLQYHKNSRRPILFQLV